MAEQQSAPSRFRRWWTVYEVERYENGGLQRVSVNVLPVVIGLLLLVITFGAVT